MKEKSKILLPDGSDAAEVEIDQETERSKERAQENKDYVSVIVKRNDEVAKHPDDTLERAINEGLEQLKRPLASLILSSIAAGLILGFVPMLVAFASGLLPPESSVMMQRLAMAIVYPLGFIVCIVSGTQLFTEHTAIAMFPILDRKANVLRLVRLWLIVLVGNFIGTFICSNLLIMADGVVQIGHGYLHIAEHLLDANSRELIISSILAGWLMAQGAWLVLSTPPSSIQLICIYIVTFIIGIGGLHHSIAGSAELFTGYLSSDAISGSSIVKFLALAVFGNAVGGSFFVGVLNYGHIRQSQIVS